MKDKYYNATVSGAQDNEYLEKKKPVFASRYLIWHSWKENNACLYDYSIEILYRELYARYTEEISEIVKNLNRKGNFKNRKHGVKYLICQIKDK